MILFLNSGCDFEKHSKTITTNLNYIIVSIKKNSEGTNTRKEFKVLKGMHLLRVRLNLDSFKLRIVHRNKFVVIMSDFDRVCHFYLLTIDDELDLRQEKIQEFDISKSKKTRGKDKVRSLTKSYYDERSGYLINFSVVQKKKKGEPRVRKLLLNYWPIKK